jgi:hypothetical protein
MKFNLASIKDLVDLVNKLSIGLRQLTFEDNMDSFIEENIEADVYVAATQNNPEENVITIRNKLTFIPNKYIITSQIGHGVVTKTGTWTKDFLYLKNNGPDPVTITVIFMR